MLIFSQFTSMLDGIAARLKQEDIPYYVLKGSTPKQERMQLVTAFNQDETPVFLISLKSGIFKRRAAGITAGLKRFSSSSLIYLTGIS